MNIFLRSALQGWALAGVVVTPIAVFLVVLSDAVTLSYAAVASIHFIASVLVLSQLGWRFWK